MVSLAAAPVFLLQEVEAPALQTVSACMDRKMASEGPQGRARLNAVRSCVRAIETLRRWLLRAHRLPFPKHVVHFIDRVHARAAEPCGPTVQGQVVRALTWIERVADRQEVQQVIANTEMHFGAAG